jgi:hypothetical protein
MNTPVKNKGKNCSRAFSDQHSAAGDKDFIDPVL